MNRNTTFDIDAIMTDYKAGMTVREIAAKHGCSPSVPSYWAKELGLAKRGKDGHKITATKCPKCHKTISIYGAKFCPFCATDIQSPKDKVIAMLTKVMPMVSGLPETQRDEFMATLQDAIRSIKENW